MNALPPARLVAADALAARLDDEHLRVFDATTVLDLPERDGPYTIRSGRPGYDAAHVPGAAFADHRDLSEPDAPHPFTVPSAERFAAAAGRLGIGDGVEVVVYSQTTPMWATRLWWLLRVFGFDAVEVLDGGLDAWRRAGHAVSGIEATYPPATFVPRPRPALLASRADVAAIVDGAPGRLVNALSPAAFRGEGVCYYPRRGRIPGSTSLHWERLIEPGTGCFRPPQELVATVAAATVDDAPVVAYCGAGISATVDLFALALLDRDGRLYDGSLTEWAADATLPLDTG